MLYDTIKPTGFTMSSCTKANINVCFVWLFSLLYFQWTKTVFYFLGFQILYWGAHPVIPVHHCQELKKKKVKARALRGNYIVLLGRTVKIGRPDKDKLLK